MEISDNHEKKDSETPIEKSQEENSENLSETIETLNTTKLESELNSEEPNQDTEIIPNQEGLTEQIKEVLNLDSTDIKEITENSDESEMFIEEKHLDPVFDGTEISETENQIGSSSVWPEKAAALKNYVKEKGSSVLRRLSGKKEEGEEEGSFRNLETNKGPKDEVSEIKEESQKSGIKEEESTLKSVWNPLSFIKGGKTEEQKSEEKSVETPDLKGRIVIYTKLGCQDCKSVRNFMREKNLKFTEINIDIFPSRKLELEKNTSNKSYTIPLIYFNNIQIGGLKELTDLEQSNSLENKINEILYNVPEASAPSPPLPGEDDESASGKIDELAIIVRKMKESIIPKDRFYKMRRFSNCFLGSEVVDFLSEDQYLERPEAIEFGQKLMDHLFFKHVLEDTRTFQDSSTHLYRFPEHDPIISTQCQNIPRMVLDVLPKPVSEIAGRLRVLSQAIFEAYVTEDGMRVDYKSIGSSEEFKRYVRITSELHRISIKSLSREETLAFFINLFNSMFIHAILVLGFPTQPLERRRFYGDFKYVIGGDAYSLSGICNGVLRANRRPPYSLGKPFGVNDRRTKSVVLQDPEPLVHFALVSGTKSGPALRCYSPGNIDKELMDSAREFMRNGGLTFDADAKIVSASRILSWYSVDFGKNEMEVIKHAANYLEPAKKEELMELLANTQLKVNYQPYDWGLNA